MKCTWLIFTALLMQCLTRERAHAGEPATGWRGNGTGLWPEATAPYSIS
jgi:hypothetical protein